MANLNHFLAELTPDELEIVLKVESYNKSKKMSLREKLHHARLVVLYDLELEQFTQEKQRQELDRFAGQLENILKKLMHTNAQSSIPTVINL